MIKHSCNNTVLCKIKFYNVSFHWFMPGSDMFFLLGVFAELILLSMFLLIIFKMQQGFIHSNGSIDTEREYIKRVSKLFVNRFAILLKLNILVFLLLPQ